MRRSLRCATWPTSLRPPRRPASGSTERRPARSTSYTAQDYRYPTCFVVGSEGQGLGRRVESLCDVMVSLPLAGQGGLAQRQRVDGDPAVRSGCGSGRRSEPGPRRDRRRETATMTVYLIDGYNVLHQFIGHKQLGASKGCRQPEAPRAPAASPTWRTRGSVCSTASPVTWAAPPTGPSWCSIPTPRCCKSRRVQLPMSRSISGRFRTPPIASSRGRFMH